MTSGYSKLMPAAVLGSAFVIGTIINYSCSEDVKVDPSKDYGWMLRNASRVTVEEDFFTWGKTYDIFVNKDKEKVGQVKGEVLPLWGDTYVLRDLAGNILAKEKEKKRVIAIDRSADFFDGEGNLIGNVSEETWEDLLSFKRIFHFYDPSGVEIGQSEKSSISFGYADLNILDKKGQTDYTIEREFTLLDDEYTITVHDPNSRIPIEQAVLITCIEDAIADAQSRKNNSSDDVNKAADSLKAKYLGKVPDADLDALTAVYSNAKL